jgi:hypothetical protein
MWANNAECDSGKPKSAKYWILEIQTPCGSNPDGSTIYCSELVLMKDLFRGGADEREHVSWRPEGSDKIYRPLSVLAADLGKYGIEVRYDEEDLMRQLGGPPDSDGPGRPSAAA